MKSLPGYSRLLGVLVIIAAAAVVSVSTTGLVSTDNGSGGLTFVSDLSGAQEVSAVDTDTTGNIQVSFNEDLSAADFTLSVFNGVAVTQAHLHCGQAGTNGPFVAFLFGLVNPGVDINGELATGTLTNADILAKSSQECGGVTINNIASLAFAAQEGLIYANVHTEANGGGEVRGQLNGGGGESFAAGLSGEQEVSAVNTNTTGNVQVSFNEDLSAADFTLSVFNGAAVTQAHLHCGRAGTNGPFVAFLFGLVDPGVDINGELATGTLTSADILAKSSQECSGVTINNIASLALAAQQGLIYANVHTEANGGGEVRGQLLLAPETPAVPEDLTCDGIVNLFDAILLLQRIIGLVDITPCG